MSKQQLNLNEIVKKFQPEIIKKLRQNDKVEILHVSSTHLMEIFQVSKYKAYKIANLLKDNNILKKVIIGGGSWSWETNDENGREGDSGFTPPFHCWEYKIPK